MDLAPEAVRSTSVPSSFSFHTPAPPSAAQTCQACTVQSVVCATKADTSLTAHKTMELSPDSHKGVAAQEGTTESVPGCDWSLKDGIDRISRSHIAKVHVGLPVRYSARTQLTLDTASYRLRAIFDAEPAANLNPSRNPDGDLYLCPHPI